jgi:hypothetical protein
MTSGSPCTTDEQLAGLDAVFTPGGHGPMVDLADSADVTRLLTILHAKAAPIARGAYVRVQGEDEITLTAGTLRRYLGPEFEIQSIGAMMSAFSGRVITTSDSITWQSIAARVAERKAAKITEQTP